MDRHGMGRHGAILGTAVVFTIGALLHFVFEWLDGWPPAALIAAVNESTWEHLKMAFWPGLAWAALGPVRSAPDRAAAWAGWGLALAVVSIVIVAAFEGYTAILGRNLLPLDIAIFAIGIGAGQASARPLAARAGRSRALRLFGHALLAAQVLAFAAFTYFPPPLGLFEDPRNGAYGLAAHRLAAAGSHIGA